MSLMTKSLYVSVGKNFLIDFRSVLRKLETKRFALYIIMEIELKLLR